MFYGSNVDRFDIISDMTLKEDCTTVYDFLNSIKGFTLYASNNILINGGKDALSISTYDITEWDKWLDKNYTRFFNAGLRAYDYRVVGWQAADIVAMPKCTCGITITLGRDDNLMYHSDWCDLIGKGK